MNKDNIIIIVCSILLALNLLFPSGEVAYTNSMYPTLKGGQAIILSRFQPANLTNCIVVFKLHDNFNVVHRVINDNGTWIQTKGDNMPEPDPYHIPKSDVIGIVILTLPSYLIYKAAYTIMVLTIGIPYIILTLKKSMRKRKHDTTT